MTLLLKGAWYKRLSQCLAVRDKDNGLYSAKVNLAFAMAGFEGYTLTGTNVSHFLLQFGVLIRITNSLMLMASIGSLTASPEAV